MTSLSYSPWVPDKTPKKRNPTYDKPVPLLDANNDLQISSIQHLNDYNQSSNEKQSEIHDLLDKMNREQMEQSPPLIQPISPPQLIQKNNETPFQNNLFTPDSSNYKTVYQKGTTYQPDHSLNKNSYTDPNNQLLEKLNYMIYLLEQQQNEKTDHILEEFLLYCFLGIFMIYIVDGFARSGSSHSVIRYTR